MPTWLSLTEFEQIDVFFNVCLRGKASKNLLRDISPIRGGGFHSPPARKIYFFQDSACPECKTIFIKTIFLYCHPCSKEVFIKMWEKSWLLPQKGFVGGGSELMGQVPKKSYFFYWRPSWENVTDHPGPRHVASVTLELSFGTRPSK